MASLWSDKRRGGGQELDSVCSVIALLFILVACVELCCDAATVVDVYRLIQYDLAGAPFGSRLATLNHHAGSLPSAPGADLSRSVVMVPVRELNLTFIREYIAKRQPLGGLLFLLPRMFNGEQDGLERSDQNFGEELLRNVLAELEQLLIRSHLPEKRGLSRLSV